MWHRLILSLQSQQPRPKMQDLPHDVWELVAAHIAIGELMALAAVNRTFLNIVLNERYQEVDWMYINKTAKSLERLLDKNIACRVERLYIRKFLMQTLLNKRVFQESPSNLVGKLKGFITGFHEESRSPDSPTPLHDLEARPKDILHLMALVINSMTNLRLLVLEWSDFSFNRDTRQLLESSKSVLDGRLTTFVFHTQLSGFNSMISGARLDGLEELELKFEIDYAATLENMLNVAQSINYLSPSLSSLTIISESHLDHSCFFKALGHFPRLRSLSIQLPFDTIHLSDPLGINDILYLHTYTLCRLDVQPDLLDGVDTHRTSTWPAFLEECLLCLAQWPMGLQSVTMPCTDLPTVMSLIRPVVRSLTSLRLVNRYLTYLEVADVVDLFNQCPSQLEHLSLDVTLATPNLISLLARRLPGLMSLILAVQDPMKSMNALLTTDPSGYDKIDWNLYDLSIFNKKFRDDSVVISRPVSFEVEERLMHQLSRLLPFVRSFKGRGHTELIQIY